MFWPDFFGRASVQLITNQGTGKAKSRLETCILYTLSGVHLLTECVSEWSAWKVNTKNGTKKETKTKKQS